MNIALVADGPARSGLPVWLMTAAAVVAFGKGTCFVWRPRGTILPEGRESLLREAEEGYGRGSGGLLARLSFGPVGRRELETYGDLYGGGRLLCLKQEPLGETAGEYALQEETKRLCESAEASYDYCLTDLGNKGGAAWQEAVGGADLVVACAPADEGEFALFYERYRMLSEKMLYLFLCTDPQSERAARRIAGEYEIAEECFLLMPLRRGRPYAGGGEAVRECLKACREERELPEAEAGWREDISRLWRALARRLTEAEG